MLGTVAGTAAVGRGSSRVSRLQLQPGLPTGIAAVGRGGPAASIRSSDERSRKCALRGRWSDGWRWSGIGCCARRQSRARRTREVSRGWHRDKCPRAEASPCIALAVHILACLAYPETCARTQPQIHSTGRQQRRPDLELWQHGQVEQLHRLKGAQPEVTRAI